MRGALFVLLGLFIAATVGVAVDEQVVQQVSANGSRNLRPFTVRDNWELRWDAKGQVFSVTLYTAKGDHQDSLASQGKPGPGSTFYPKGGSYYLRVSANGDWTITVVQLP